MMPNPTPRRTIAIPIYILNDDAIMQIVNDLLEVANALGHNAQDVATVEALLNELDSRATTTYKLVNGQIVKKD